MADAQNISIEIDAMLVDLIAQLNAKLADTQLALDICWNQLSAMDRIAVQAEFKEKRGYSPADSPAWSKKERNK